MSVVEMPTGSGVAPAAAPKPQKPPHFTAQRADLVRELSLAVGSVEKRTTIPILGNVKIASDQAGITLVATDLNVAMVCRCAANVRVAGAITLPAKRLLDYVRLLPDGPIEIKVGDSNWATITAGRSRTRIAGMSPESFPDMPAVPASPTCTIGLTALAKMIQRTSFAICMEESRFTLSGAMLDMGDDFKMIATDGHRLALASTPGFIGKPDKNLIPKRAMAEVVKMAGACGADAVVSFSMDENEIFFQIGTRVLMARKTTGNFPDYVRAMPKVFTGTAIVEREELRGALDRVRRFTDERSRAVRLTIGDGKISIFGAALEQGESEEAVLAEVEGSVVIGLNADYLVDFLSAAESEKVRLSFGDAKTALTCTQEGASDYTCVIMPMRI